MIQSFDFRSHCQKVSKELVVDDHPKIMFHQLVFGCFLPDSIRFALVSFSFFGRFWSFLNVSYYSNYVLAVLSPSACLSQENRKLNKAHSIAFWMICFVVSSHYDALGDRNQAIRAAVNHLTRLVPLKKKLDGVFICWWHVSSQRIFILFFYFFYFFIFYFFYFIYFLFFIFSFFIPLLFIFLFFYFIIFFIFSFFLFFILLSFHFFTFLFFSFYFNFFCVYNISDLLLFLRWHSSATIHIRLGGDIATFHAVFGIVNQFWARRFWKKWSLILR